MRTPKYRPHSTRDFALVEWKGKRHRLPGKFNSFESRQAYRQFLREHVYGDEQPIGDVLANRTFLTVGELGLGFLQEALQRYGDELNSEYGNVELAMRYLNEFAGLVPVLEFGPKRLRAYRQWRSGQGDSPAYINSQVNRIKRAFRWAVSEELIPASVVTGLESVDGLAQVQPKRAVVPWEHVEAVLPLVNSTVRAMTLLQWYTGARSESICLATPAQFDCTRQPWFWRPLHKTQKTRRLELVLPVGPNAQAAIAHLFGDDDEPLFSPRRLSNNRSYGQTYRVRSYRQALVRAQDKVNEERKKNGLDAFPGWFPHQLRHSRGQLVLEKYGAEAAQAILGHDSLDATRLYTSRRFELAVQAAKEMG